MVFGEYQVLCDSKLWLAYNTITQAPPRFGDYTGW